MNASQTEKLTEKIDTYPADYLPLKNQAKKYLPNNSTSDNNGTLNILHRPWVAPFNWGLILYSGADKNWIPLFEQRSKKIIPGFYKDFLLTINGCFIYDLSLFGLTPSLYVKGTMDRSLLQCHDLVVANTHWMNEYKVDKNCFHFGSRAYTYDENIGYFFDNDEIRSVRKNGKMVKVWMNFKDFLNDEIMEAENVMLKEIPEGTKILAAE